MSSLLIVYKKFVFWRLKKDFSLKEMSIKIGHPYHLVDPSPWPLFSSVAALGIATGLIEIFYFKNYRLLALSSILLTSILIQ